jgi:hypothetical protein
MAALVVAMQRMPQPLDHQEHQVKAMQVVWVAELRLTKLLAVVVAQALKVVMVWLALLVLAGLVVTALRQASPEAA